MGWDEQGDGRWFYGLNVENGRIKDTPEMQLKTAIREICRTLQPVDPPHLAPEHPLRRHSAAGPHAAGEHSARRTA